jgi:hypothetical protein
MMSRGAFLEFADAQPGDRVRDVGCDRKFGVPDAGTLCHPIARAA